MDTTKTSLAIVLGFGLLVAAPIDLWAQSASGGKPTVRGRRVDPCQQGKKTRLECSFGQDQLAGPRFLQPVLSPLR